MWTTQEADEIVDVAAVTRNNPVWWRALLQQDFVGGVVRAVTEVVESLLTLVPHRADLHRHIKEHLGVCTGQWSGAHRHPHARACYALT